MNQDTLWVLFGVAVFLFIVSAAFNVYLILTSPQPLVEKQAEQIAKLEADIGIHAKCEDGLRVELEYSNRRNVDVTSRYAEMDTKHRANWADKCQENNAKHEAWLAEQRKVRERDDTIADLRELQKSLQGLIKDRDDTISKLTSEIGELEASAMQFTESNAELRKRLARPKTIKTIAAAREPARAKSVKKV